MERLVFRLADSDPWKLIEHLRAHLRQSFDAPPEPGGHLWGQRTSLPAFSMASSQMRQVSGFPTRWTIALHSSESTSRSCSSTDPASHDCASASLSKPSSRLRSVLSKALAILRLPSLRRHSLPEGFVMTASSRMRGHRIQWDPIDRVWRHADDGSLTESGGAPPRPCVECDRLPTPEGHDACLGTIEGVSSACCGHGVEEPYQKLVAAPPEGQS